VPCAPKFTHQVSHHWRCCLEPSWPPWSPPRWFSTRRQLAALPGGTTGRRPKYRQGAAPSKWSEKGENVSWLLDPRPRAASPGSSGGTKFWGHVSGRTTGQEFSPSASIGTGKIVPEVQISRPPSHRSTTLTPPPSPTPVIEDGRINVHFGAPAPPASNTTTGKVHLGAARKHSSATTSAGARRVGGHALW